MVVVFPVNMRTSLKDTYLFLFVHCKGLLAGGFARKHYGQWAEDVVLERIFARQEKGFYVDVGAYHPMHYSNTYLLYKRGWRGINIEPNPWSIRLFALHRRGDKNLNCGVAEEEGERTYFVFNHQSCNTFSPEQKEEILKKPFIRLLEERQVRCLPLRDIIREHSPGNDIDLLNVDVEGMGLEVLRTLDWDTQAPRVICVEDDAFDTRIPQGYGSALYTFLRDRSYALHTKVGPTCIYVR